jgi:DNA polymerase-3 subunit gamma/tau
LLAFDGQQVEIAVRTQPLLKHAQTKLTTIEAAFQAICQSQVKVNFQVPARQKSKIASQVETREATAPELEQPSQNGEAPAFTLAEQPVAQTPLAPKLETSQVRSATSEDVSLPNVASKPKAISYQSLEWETSEVAIASRSLAQAFAGEIIPIGDELAIDEPSPMLMPLSTAIEATEIEPEERDDEDVPF